MTLSGPLYNADQDNMQMWQELLLTPACSHYSTHGFFL